MNEVRLPLALRRRSPEEELREEIAPYVDMTLEERSAILCSLARSAAKQVEEHPQRQKVERWRDPLSPEAEALWRELVRQGHRR
jgi:hypothetical protein